MDLYGGTATGLSPLGMFEKESPEVTETAITHILISHNSAFAGEQRSRQGKRRPGYSAKQRFSKWTEVLHRSPSILDYHLQKGGSLESGWLIHKNHLDRGCAAPLQAMI